MSSTCTTCLIRRRVRHGSSPDAWTAGWASARSAPASAAVQLRACLGGPDRAAPVAGEQASRSRQDVVWCPWTCLGRRRPGSSGCPAVTAISAASSCPAACSRPFAHEELGVPQSKLAFMPPGVDTKFWKGPPPPATALLLRRLGESRLRHVRTSKRQRGRPGRGGPRLRPPPVTPRTLRRPRSVRHLSGSGGRACHPR
jgi:hypothetical protein